MRPKISKSNVNFYLRQEYGFNSVNQFFQMTEHQLVFREKVTQQIVTTFTNYAVRENGKLSTPNPYTAKYETLNIKDFKHILNPSDLIKDLSMLHKTRMTMLEQSRKRILELNKQKTKTRDNDLLANTQERSKKRIKSLERIPEESRSAELEH